VALVSGALAALGALTVVPLAAAWVASPRATAFVAVFALLATLLAGVSGDAFGPAHSAALVAVAATGAMAVALAAERIRRERTASFASYLGEAGALLSCSLEFDETAKSAAAVPVPELADWALVELLDAGGRVERRAASHPDDAAEEIAALLGEAGAGGGPLAELWTELPDDLLTAAAAGDDEKLERLRGVGAGAAMRIPLRTPERRVGVMTLLSAGSGRSYGETELRRAEELAARAAMAIENASLYRAARRGERRFARRAEPPASGKPDPRARD
jgi:hypothetical protein